MGITLRMGREDETLKGGDNQGCVWKQTRDWHYVVVLRPQYVWKRRKLSQGLISDITQKRVGNPYVPV